MQAGTFWSKCPLFLLILYALKSVDGAPGKVCTSIDQCSCRLSDGSKISLWPIDDKKGPRFVDTIKGKMRFSYSPCTAFTLTVNPSKCKNTLICKQDLNLVGSIPVSLAFPGSMVSKFDESFNGYVFSYTGSHIQNPQQLYKSIVKLRCDSNAVSPRITDFVGSDNTFSTTLTSKYACPVGNRRNALSVGSILCIVMLSTAFVYLVAGILINKFICHKEGSELIPQKSFWQNLPGYVKDGFLFTYHKIRGKSGQYEML